MLESTLDPFEFFDIYKDHATMVEKVKKYSINGLGPYD